MEPAFGPARPVVFPDVDGPLIPFGVPSDSYPTSTPLPDGNPLLARVDPEHGPRLMALGCELVRATTWMVDANDCIAPRLGLPELPVVEWPDAPETEEQDERNGLHWKTRPLVAWAAGRLFAWLDDEITDTDRTWVSVHHPGEALLHRVNPTTGLTHADYHALNKWLRHC